jgi:predicted MFS family arabinose efflux permease
MAQLSEEHQARAILRLSFAAFSSAIALRMCDPMLPILAREFQTTTGQAAHVIAYFSIAYGLLQAFYGPLGDRYGKFRIVTFATLGSTIGALGALAAGSMGWLVVCRVLTGSTAAAIIPLSMAWIGDNIPYERRQATLARFLTGQILGMAMGQLIGGFFSDTVGWRWAFALLGGLYIGIGLMLFAELRGNRHIDSASLQAAASAPRRNLLQQFGGVAAIPWALVVLLTVFLEGLLVFGAFAFIPSFLHHEFGLSLLGAGAIFGIYGLGGIFYTILTGHLVARLGERGLTFCGGVLLSAAFIVFFVADAWQWAIPASFMAGLGFYMLHNTLQTNATQMAPRSRGTAVSMFAASFFMGQAAGVAIAAYVVDNIGTVWLFCIAAVAVLAIGAGFGFTLRYRQAWSTQP